MNTYALGPVRPHVKAAAEEVGTRFDVGTVYGFAQRTYASEHPKGLALDFMVYGDRAKGDAVAAYLQANASRLAVDYIIWYQQIWSVARSDEGWRGMSNRGSATANHIDHVHVSFTAEGATTNAGFPVPMPDVIPDFIPDAAGDVVNMIKGIYNVMTSWAKIALFLSDPRNHVRIGLFILGTLLVGSALIATTRAGNAVTTAKNTATTIGKAASNVTS